MKKEFRNVSKLLVSDVLLDIIIFLSLFVTSLIVEPNDVKNDQGKKKTNAKVRPILKGALGLK